jgi:hypothetical protein
MVGVNPISSLSVFDWLGSTLISKLELEDTPASKIQNYRETLFSKYKNLTVIDYKTSEGREVESTKHSSVKSQSEVSDGMYDSFGENDCFIDNPRLFYPNGYKTAELKEIIRLTSNFLIKHTKFKKLGFSLKLMEQKEVRNSIKSIEQRKNKKLNQKFYHDMMKTKNRDKDKDEIIIIPKKSLSIPNDFSLLGRKKNGNGNLLISQEKNMIDSLEKQMGHLNLKKQKN